MARADGLSGPVGPGRGSGGGSGSGSGPHGRGGRAGGPGGRRRAPRRLRFIFAGVLLLLLLEIVVLITVGQAIGAWWTLALLLIFVVLGLFLVRRESGRTWRALRQAVDTGRMPGQELADATLVLLGGLFLIIPGFISDVVGIFLILPFTRRLSRRFLGVLIGSRMTQVTVTGFPGSGHPNSSAAGGPGAPGRPGGSRSRDDVIEGEIIDEDPPPDR